MRCWLHLLRGRVHTFDPWRITDNLRSEGRLDAPQLISEEGMRPVVRGSLFVESCEPLFQLTDTLLQFVDLVMKLFGIGQYEPRMHEVRSS